MFFYISVVSMLIALFSVVVAVTKRTGQAQKWMLLSSIAAFFYFGACYYKCYAESLQMLMAAQKVIYLSTSCLVLSCVRTLAYICEVKLKEWYKWTLVGITSVSVLLSLSIDMHSAWYKTYEAVPNPNLEGCYQLLVSNGWLYYAGNVLILLPILATAAYIFIDVLKKPGKKMMVIRTIVIIVAAITVIWLISLTGLFSTSEANYAIALGLIIAFLFIQLRFDMLSTEAIAKERLVEDSKEGLIALDNDDEFFYANKAAKTIFPALTRNKMSSVNAFIKDVLLKQEVYEFNEHVYTIRTQKFLDEEGTSRGRLIVAADITEAYSNMRNLTVLNKRLEVERTIFRDSIMNGSMFTLIADITEGVILSDIIDPDGNNLLNALGFTVPAPYDEEGRAFINKMGVSFANDAHRRFFTAEGVKKMYDEGLTSERMELYLRATNTYVSITSLLYIDPSNGHLMCYAPCRDVTEFKRREEEYISSLTAAKVSEKSMDTALKSIADVYDTLYLIDIKAGEFAEFGSNNSVRAIVEENTNIDIQQLIWKVMKMRICEEDIPKVLEFTQFITLNQRLSGLRQISVEVHNTDNKWFRFMFIRVGAIDSEVSRVIFASQNIEGEKKA